MVKPRSMTHQERRAKPNAWLKNADEVLAEYEDPPPDDDEPEAA